MKPRLIVLLKAPWPGRVKTRLARDIGAGPAAAWSRRQSFDMIRRLGRDPRWRLELWIAPDQAVAAPYWPARPARRPQGSGDLGTRMRRALTADSTSPAVLIGADIPGITPAHIHRAFQALGRAAFVFGPADDGGFWLVGRRPGRTPAHLFQGARWSTRHALPDALASLDGESAALVDRLGDIDTLDDYKAAAMTSRAAALSWAI